MAIQAVNGANDLYGQIASGKRINSAADDAAGLAIANKMKTQETGLNQGAANAKDGIGVLNIADGALGQVNDYLQRIYEIGIKASNSALYSASDLSAMQAEVGQLMDGIQQVATGTEYNTMKLLDGSMADMDLATNPEGGGLSIKMQNSTLEALGIDGFDVTGKFDLNRITDAIAKVNESRSHIGAQTNALESVYDYNNYASQNTTASRSGIEDLDMAKAVSDQKKNELINTYQIMMQKKQQENEQNLALGVMNF